ncbi:hypothetical protein [Paraburkholderia sp. EG304]|uniref:hypothetical protein n=1 Tax=Paraburkholderia sp. EG304 TaxID=3237015 RepID=UPI00397DF95D
MDRSFSYTLAHPTTPVSASRAAASPPERPASPQVQFGHLPAALKAESCWCAWKNVLDGQCHRWVKTPINAVTRRSTKSNRPETWSDQQTAFKALHRDRSLPGLGFSPGGSPTRIDINLRHDFCGGSNAIAFDVRTCFYQSGILFYLQPVELPRGRLMRPADLVEQLTRSPA